MTEKIRAIIETKAASTPEIIWNARGKNYLVNFERESNPTPDEFKEIKKALSEVGNTLDNSFGKIVSLVIIPS